MISVILPTYKNPQYLDMCLKSITEGQDSTNEIIVVVDGFIDKSKDVLKKYKNVYVMEFEENRGIQTAMNLGVWNASNEKVFIVNDDNVLPKGWDTRLEEVYEPNTIFTVNQIEPKGPSMYRFPIVDCGADIESFDFEKYLSVESELSRREVSSDGNIFPIFLNKKWYVTVGGLDTFYNSPNWCDIDFFMKLQMIPGVKYAKTHYVHLYHFGSVSTRKNGEAEIFQALEKDAMSQYHYKWGYVPNLFENAIRYNNSKLPFDGQTLRGINL